MPHLIVKINATIHVNTLYVCAMSWMKCKAIEQ